MVQAFGATAHVVLDRICFRLLEDMLRQVVLFWSLHDLSFVNNFLQICCVVLIGLADFIGI